MYSNQGQFNQQHGIPVVVQQYPYERPIRRSGALIGFGITAIVISAILGVWSIWLCAYGDFNIVAGSLSLVCACFHIILGIFAILGGRDTERNRCSLITCLVLGIVGCTVFVVAALTTDIIALTLTYCNYNCTNQHCYTYCSNYLAPIVGVPAVLACIIEGIVGIVLSSVTCCHVCKCCKDGNNTGVVIRQPNVGTILNNHQQPYYGYSTGQSQAQAPQNAYYGNSRQVVSPKPNEQPPPGYQPNPSDTEVLMPNL